MTAFPLAYGPFQLSNWQEDPELEKRVRARMLPHFAILLTGLAVVLSLFAREVAQAVSPHYPTAYEAVGLLSMSVAVFGVSNIALAGIALTRRTGYIAIYTGAALILNVVLNLLLIPPWGMMGSAFATLAAYALLAALYYWRSQILYPTHYVLRKTLVVLASGELASLVGLIRFAELGVSIAVKLATLLAFVASLWLFGAIDDDDLAGLRLVLGGTRAATTPPAGEGNGRGGGAGAGRGHSGGRLTAAQRAHQLERDGTQRQHGDRQRGAADQRRGHRPTAARAPRRTRPRARARSARRRRAVGATPGAS